MGAAVKGPLQGEVVPGPDQVEIWLLLRLKCPRRHPYNRVMNFDTHKKADKRGPHLACCWLNSNYNGYQWLPLLCSSPFKVVTWLLQVCILNWSYWLEAISPDSLQQQFISVV